MTLIDLHPDELMGREMEGRSLTADERSHLEDHLARCEECRLERSLADQFRPERAVTEDDRRLAARLVAEALRPTTVRPAGRPPSRLRWGLIAAVAVFMLTATAAAVFFAVDADEPTTAAPTREVTTPKPPTEARRVSVDPIPEPEPEREVTEEPSEPVVEEPVAERPRRERPTASELFRRANEARRDGRYSDAVRWYRTLQRWHRGTRQEIHSRVGLGHLLLSRLNDPEGALPLFDSYLAVESRGALREEARLGRALSLRRLGRTNEERQAWDTLLREHPDSIHAERARRRLSELR